MAVDRDKVDELNKQIADLKKRWPAHSVPPSMMEHLDELEEELNREMQKSGKPDHPRAGTQLIRLQAIGYVENDLEEPTSPDKFRKAESRILLAPSLVEGLIGLEPGQQIMVLFYFHLSEGYDLLQHPRGDQSRTKRGVFALHSPRRPNPIGVTVVELLGIEGNTLRVRGLDAVNGTPVLDLKLVQSTA